MATLPFVFVDGNNGKVNTADREFIRSHCMEGKNKRQNSRRCLQEQRKAQRLSAQHRQNPHTYAAVTSVPPAPTTDIVSSQARVNKAMSRHLSVSAQCFSPQLDWEISRHVHEDTIVYPRNLMSNSDILVHVKKISSPIYNYIHFEDRPAKGPLLWIMYDDLFRHAVQLLVSAFKERMRQESSSTTTYRQYLETLTLLNNRLCIWNQDRIIDTTIWTINILANLAIWGSRYNEASTHTSALREIIEIAGGESYLISRPTLRYQLFSFELAISSATGKKPHSTLQKSRCKSRSVYEYPIQNLDQLLLSASSPHSDDLDSLLDKKVMCLFRRLQAITLQINEKRHQGSLPDSSTFQATYEAAWTDLLELNETLNDTLSECLQLTLLAFLTVTVFQIPNDRANHGGKSKLYPFLAKNLRKKWQGLEPTAQKSTPLLFWLLTVAAMSVFDVDTEDWLSVKWKRAAAEVLGIQTGWDHARRQLESVMWIPVVHDVLGQQIYSKLMADGSGVDCFTVLLSAM